MNWRLFNLLMFIYVIFLLYRDLGDPTKDTPNEHTKQIVTAVIAGSLLLYNQMNDIECSIEKGQKKNDSK